MQAQANRQLQDTITAAQSLQTVQTLLKAGLGCIAYLRDLLPQENFSSSLLTSSSTSSLSSHASDAGIITPGNRTNGASRNVSGFHVMTVTRGWSAEADRLLDYLDGIFDALEKQYLRSFIFAIYLDNEDPNNIVEAYTFNFKYHHIPGSDTIVPIMSLGEDLMNMSLADGPASRDPVTQATTEGRPPTLRDVKRSLKTLIKVLINATTQMDSLPKRRFATFKTFYYPHTPASYEPPHFRAGDYETDRWFFTTHQKNEVPEKCSIGKLETGWHGVNVHIASVSAYIPSSTDDNDAPFSGTTDGPNRGPFVLGTTSRQAQIEVQHRDAQDRKVVWDAEILGRCDSRDVDAEGEDDPDCALGLVNDSGVGLDAWVPLGVRQEDGDIVPLSREEHAAERRVSPADNGVPMDVDEDGTTQELVFGGIPESIPQCIQQLNTKTSRPEEAEGLGQTQQMSVSGEAGHSSSFVDRGISPVSMSRAYSAALSRITNSPLPPSDIPTHECSMASATTHGLDTQMVMDAVEGIVLKADTALEEMLDMETQTPQSGMTDDPIESYSNLALGSGCQTPTRGNLGTVARKLTEEPTVVECECGVTAEDDEIILCEGKCGKWYHIWCMGFHSAKDKRLPEEFLCFHCRLSNDKNIEMIVVQSWYQDIFSSFGRLALFRRAIKIAETHEPDSSKAFTKLIGCEALVAGQLFKRLETEGFIGHQVNLDAGIDEAQDRARGRNGKGKAKQRKNMQKPKYIFVKSSKRGQRYLDYFNPSASTEMKMMGINELAQTTKRTARATAAESSRVTRANSKMTATFPPAPLALMHPPRISETQTQDETQTVAPATGVDLKRKNLNLRQAPDSDGRKKIKISVVSPVDLYD